MVFPVLLAGCAARETFETVDDVYSPQKTTVREIVLTLPEQAAATAMEGQEGEKLYVCENYDVAVQILPGGSMDSTVQTLTGLSPEHVMVLETGQEDCRRFDFTWCAAGETGEVIGRAAVLDDGCSHYCLTAMADAAGTGDVRNEWNQLFSSFGVSSY